MSLLEKFKRAASDELDVLPSAYQAPILEVVYFPSGTEPFMQESSEIIKTYLREMLDPAKTLSVVYRKKSLNLPHSGRFRVNKIYHDHEHGECNC